MPLYGDQRRLDFLWMGALEKSQMSAVFFFFFFAFLINGEMINIHSVAIIEFPNQFTRN